MTFHPQYGHWSRETFSDSGGAIYENPGEFEIRGGVTKLIPVNFNTGTYSFNAPWDQVPEWHINSTMDSKSIVTGDFFIYTGTTTSSYGNIGTYYNSAFYTSGNQSCFVLGLGPDGLGSGVTIELDTRSLWAAQSGSLTGTGDCAFYPSIIFARNGTELKYAQIEIRPDGLRIPYISGAYIPGDYNDALRAIRIIKNGDDIILMTQKDEQVLYVNDGMQDYSSAIPNVEDYIAFGSWPQVQSNKYYSGAAGNAKFIDFYTSPNSSGFQGMALWDDVKINTGLAVSIRPEDYFPDYPGGDKVIYTDEWHPSNSITSYQNAFVSVIGTSGGRTKVEVEYLEPLGDYGDKQWTQYSEYLNITSGHNETYYLGLTDIPVQSDKFGNALRFKITSTKAAFDRGVPPEVDTITVIANNNANVGIIKPNWKMSALPKEHIVYPDIIAHDKYIPKPSPQDIWFLHNEDGIDNIACNTYISQAQVGLLSGLVTGTLTDFDTVPQGLVKITDGIYGNAWSNFGYSGEYVAVWESTNSYFTGSSGDGGMAEGELLDIYSIYPTGAMTLAYGTHSVKYSIYKYSDFDGVERKAQKVRVINYNKETTDSSYYDTWVGMHINNMQVPSKTGTQRQFGIIEGIIKIPKGPGVTIALHEGATTSKVFLKGSEYRTPKPFACATKYFKTHTGEGQNGPTYASFGVLPRSTGLSIPNYYEYGEWTEPFDRDRVDEFILYSVTGYIADHSYIIYSGGDVTNWRIGAGITGGAQIALNWGTGWGESGTLGTVQEINENFNEQGYVVDYVPVRRNSLLFEGWFRPYGIRDHTETEQLLASLTDNHASARGMHVYLSRDGSIRTTVQTATCYASFGLMGDSVVASPVTNELNSKEYRVLWGNWNHIGICTEFAAIGDGNIASNQPAAPIDPYTREVLHGARASKIYLTLNGRIVDEVDCCYDTYSKLNYNSGALAAGYPPVDAVKDSLPPLKMLAARTGAFISTIGSGVYTDFDHVRMSVRDSADVLTDIFTLGSKDTPGLLSHKNAPKPFAPVASGVSHWELAHIYRFDEQLDKYNLLDDGFAPGHALLAGWPTLASGTSELEPYEADPIYFISEDTGPDGRRALRIGPGARIDIPWNSFDERLFNGPYSMDYSGNYIVTGTSHYTGYMADRGYAFSRQCSDSAPRMGGWFKLNKYPTTGIMDLCTFDEFGAPEDYGKHQVYMGVDYTGGFKLGTRYNFSTTNEVGPYHANVGVLDLNTWYHLGLNFSLRENMIEVANRNLWKLYLNGERVWQASISAGTGGGSVLSQGRAMAYQGIQGYGAGTNFSKFRVGGDLPRTGATHSWSYCYGDISVQDFVIGYQLQLDATGDSVGDTSQWDWAALASTGQKYGRDEIMVANGTTVATISGGPGTGTAYYPATLYEDAGEQLVFFTVNRGNDYESLLNRGLALYPEVPFVNAASYYVIYQDDNSREVIGSTDSPIQIGDTVPSEGVNLALVNISSWDPEKSISTFNLSDRTYSNITPKIFGDRYLSFDTISGSMISRQATMTDNVRVSSIPVYSNNSSISNPGYFMHQIGDDKKGVYIKSAYGHASASGDLVFSNLDKINNAISIKDVDGNEIDYETFSYKLIATGSFNNIQLQDGTFAVTLVGQKQTIGQSVFIHYPSIDYRNGYINLQDKEVYNPIPVMKHIYTDMSTPFSGEFSTNYGIFKNKFDITIYGATTGELMTDNQGSL